MRGSWLCTFYERGIPLVSILKRVISYMNMRCSLLTENILSSHRIHSLLTENMFTSHREHILFSSHIWMCEESQILCIDTDMALSHQRDTEDITLSSKCRVMTIHSSKERAIPWLSIHERVTSSLSIVLTTRFLWESYTLSIHTWDNSSLISSDYMLRESYPHYQ